MKLSFSISVATRIRSSLTAYDTHFLHSLLDRPLHSVAGLDVQIAPLSRCRSIPTSDAGLVVVASCYAFLVQFRRVEEDPLRYVRIVRALMLP